MLFDAPVYRLDRMIVLLDDSFVLLGQESEDINAMLAEIKRDLHALRARTGRVSLRHALAYVTSLAPAFSRALDEVNASRTLGLRTRFGGLSQILAWRALAALQERPAYDRGNGKVLKLVEAARSRSARVLTDVANPHAMHRVDPLRCQGS